LARAQIALPGSADPARQIQEIVPLTPGEMEYDLPTAKPRATIKVPEKIAHEKFVLKDLKIEGVTAYSPDEIQSLYQSSLGKEISVAQLYDILIALQQLYLNDGFTFTKAYIPPQTIDSGHITFKVVEGYVGEVEFETRPRPAALIDNAIARLKGMKPLNVRKLERLVLIINSQPDMHIGAVIAPPADEDASEGRLRIILRDLNKKDPVYDGAVTLDNTGSKYVGPLRLDVHGAVNHVLQPYDRVFYQAGVAYPLSELNFAGLGYTMPVLGASGINLSLRGSWSKSVPGSNLKRLDIEGRSYGFSAGLSYPFILRRDRSLIGNINFDMLNSKTDIVSDHLYNDRLRSVRAGTNLTFSDRFHGLNIIALTVSKGLEILGASKNNSDSLSRAEGRVDYTKANIALSRRQDLPHDFALVGRLEAQYTRNPLLSSEEFGIGGDSLGRGYDPSEIIGDKGIGLSLEINRTFFSKTTDLKFQPYMFYDIGKIWNIDPGASNRISLASAGGGMRIEFNKVWSANLLAAFPLTKMPDNPPNYTNGQSPRFLFSLSRKF
jgi:hemolysin activation/secretion protein